MDEPILREQIAALEAEAEASTLNAWATGRDTAAPPQIIYLCPTNACNHRCITCANPVTIRAGRGNRGVMDLDLFKRLVDQLPPGRRRIYLQKTGEPLLHPQIGEMLRYLRAARPDYEIALHTNASKLRGEIVETIIDCADFFSLSIFGFDQARYAAAHGKDDFQIFHANVEAFYQRWLRAQRRPKIYFDVVRNAHNAHLSPEEIFALLQARYPAFNVGVHFPFNFQGVLPQFDLEVFDRLKQADMPACVWPWVMMVIHWDGKLGYCVGDAYEEAFLGDATQTPLMALWNGPAYRAFRRGHAERRFDDLAQEGILCGHCNWLFGLKSQSAENLCLEARAATPSPVEHLEGGMAVTGEQHLALGLRSFLRGELPQAMHALTLAEIVSRDAALQTTARRWQGRVREVWSQRAPMETWEAALNEEGLSLATVHLTHYGVSAHPEARASDGHEQIGGVTVKKGGL
ncbi:radical SAM protein [Myxococcota bacterium]|nr:radical SAM protein [Myxococcota bacterium]MBU1899405.1 radical SAM protein [Myxococcota bacterium]